MSSMEKDSMPGLLSGIANCTGIAMGTFLRGNTVISRKKGYWNACRNRGCCRKKGCASLRRLRMLSITCLADMASISPNRTAVTALLMTLHSARDITLNTTDTPFKLSILVSRFTLSLGETKLLLPSLWSFYVSQHRRHPPHGRVLPLRVRSVSSLRRRRS